MCEVIFNRNDELIYILLLSHWILVLHLFKLQIFFLN